MVTILEATHAKRANLEPATYSLAEVARLLNIGYTGAHQMAQAGTLPVKAIKVGRQYRFPKAVVDRLLGIEPEAA